VRPPLRLQWRLAAREPGWSAVQLPLGAGHTHPMPTSIVAAQLSLERPACSQPIAPLCFYTRVADGATANRSHTICRQQARLCVHKWVEVWVVQDDRVRRLHGIGGAAMRTQAECRLRRSCAGRYGRCTHRRCRRLKAAHRRPSTQGACFAVQSITCRLIPRLPARVEMRNILTCAHEKWGKTRLPSALDQADDATKQRNWGLPTPSCPVLFTGAMHRSNPTDIRASSSFRVGL